MIIKETKDTPLVEVFINDSVITVKGKITPQNPDEFFHQLELMTDRCLEQNKTKALSLNFKLDYFNTTSSKMLARYFKSIVNKNPQINWHFEKGDEEIKEAGQDYSTLLNFPFSLVEN
jgi:hypothetical protein